MNALRIDMNLLLTPLTIKTDTPSSNTSSGSSTIKEPEEIHVDMDLKGNDNYFQNISQEISNRNQQTLQKMHSLLSEDDYKNPLLLYETLANLVLDLLYEKYLNLCDRIDTVMSGSLANADNNELVNMKTKLNDFFKIWQSLSALCPYIENSNKANQALLDEIDKLVENKSLNIYNTINQWKYSFKQCTINEIKNNEITNLIPKDFTEYALAGIDAIMRKEEQIEIIERKITKIETDKNIKN